MARADFEPYNANYIGGDINGGAQDLRQLFTRPVARLVPYSTPLALALSLLVVHAPRRGRARPVRLPRREGGLETLIPEMKGPNHDEPQSSA